MTPPAERVQNGAAARPLVSRPRLIFWESTAGCNLRCIHCRRLEVMDAVSKSDLSTEQAFRFIDDVAADYKPILILSGGEPLMRPDILTIAAHARERGLRVAAASNGTLITAGKARAIRDAGVARVSVSLDGAQAPTHERFRGPGSFQRALDGLGHLKAAGVSSQVNMTVTRYNAHELPALYELCQTLGVDALHLFMLVPVGCGVQLADSDMLPAAEYEKWLNWFYDRELEGRLELKATCAPHYFRIVRQRSRGQGLPPSHHRQAAKGGDAPGSGGHPAGHGEQALHQTTRGCLAGVGVCFVSHRGDVFPCGYLPLKAGNVVDQPFRKIWEESPVFQQLRRADQLEGKCGDCSFKVVCGGCRARAFYQYGNPMAEEPFCDYAPPRAHAGLAAS